MRWECPHCQTQLSVADDKLQAGWSFSRCFQCGGFSLVRKSDVNLIKVDHPPQGERVVLSERAGEKALRPVASTTIAQAPTIRPATRTPSLTAIALPAPTAELGASKSSAPSPIRAPRRSWNWTTVAIAVTSVITLVSGALLYLEGQALWAKAKLQASVASHETVPQAPAVVAAAPAPVAEPQAVREQLSVSAAAPIAPQLAPTAATSPSVPVGKMHVKIRTTYANLRTGPSLDFQVAGMLSQGTLLEVIDFEDRWFKVRAAESSGKPQWIRNDMVQVAYR